MPAFEPSPEPSPEVGANLPKTSVGALIDDLREKLDLCRGARGYQESPTLSGQLEVALETLSDIRSKLSSVGCELVDYFELLLPTTEPPLRPGSREPSQPVAGGSFEQAVALACLQVVGLIVLAEAQDTQRAVLYQKADHLENATAEVWRVIGPVKVSQGDSKRLVGFAVYALSCATAWFRIDSENPIGSKEQPVDRPNSSVASDMLANFEAREIANSLEAWLSELWGLSNI